jgi:predicted TIM-barrel fold metal-dependent hydrolase
MKIDAFNHFSPEPYFTRLREIAPDYGPFKLFAKLPELYNLDAHLRLVERYDDYQQILSLANPPIEMVARPNESPALARFANDELAAVCARYPDRFPGFIGSLPMNNPPAAILEAKRIVKELGGCGIQIYTNVNDRPLSSPEYFDIFAAMAEMDLPVWIHPMRGPGFSDYATENASENEIWFTFGWPYETTAAVTRLIWSGIFDKLPTLKIVTHHMGGMIPYFAQKIALGFSQIFDGRPDFNPAAAKAGLKLQPLDYYRMLYADTALNGSLGATRCGHDFFTTSHCLFASDAPFDSLHGHGLISGTIKVIDSLEITAAERAEIYGGNLRRIINRQ